VPHIPQMPTEREFPIPPGLLILSARFDPFARRLNRPHAPTTCDR
jgi:hypothetical protein